MPNLGEQIDSEITALGADFIDYRVTELTPRQATVEYYINDAATGQAVTQVTKYVIKADGTAIKKNA